MTPRPLHNKLGLIFVFGRPEDISFFCSIIYETLQELREGQKEFEVARLNLAKKYATLDKKGAPKLKDGKYTFTPDNEAKFLKEHEGLLKQTREYDIELIKLPEDFKIAAADLLLLNGVVIEL